MFESMDKHHAREFDEKKKRERKRNILHLIEKYLRDEGYLETVQQFEKESKLSSNYTVCDNIDLDLILQDFEAYYFVRVQKYPNICKKIDVNTIETKRLQLKCVKNEKKGNNNTICTVKKFTKEENNLVSKDHHHFNDVVGMSVLGVTPMGFPENNIVNDRNHNGNDNDLEKLWKSLGSFEGYSNEWKEFAGIIAKEVIDTNLNVKWNNVIGLESAKNLLKEAIVYPLKYPDFFKGIMTPWKGLLLFGPPGTGKTLLAKAVATECNTTFFNISASSLVSKWRGESEKLVRVMFELARHQAPSTIFIDELDALASRRDCPNEHEASRRMKSELLVQLDGLLQSNEQVFFLTTSNLPWDLDPAILRRLEKRILVDLPDADARNEMLKTFLPKKILSKPLVIAEITHESLAIDCFQGYSGADIKLTCKEAIMSALRPIFTALEKQKQSPGKFNRNEQIQVEPVRDGHVFLALEKTKPTTSKHLLRYKNWEAEYGSL